MKNAVWADYLKVMEKGSREAAWVFAQKHFSKDSADYKAAQRFHAPTKKQRNETAARWAAIKATTQSEINRHCQFDGLPKL